MENISLHCANETKIQALLGDEWCTIENYPIILISYYNRKE